MALVPPLSRMLLALTSSPTVQAEEAPDNELMFNLLILAEVKRAFHTYSVFYINYMIFSMYLQSFYKFRCSVVYMLSNNSLTY